MLKRRFNVIASSVAACLVLLTMVSCKNNDADGKKPTKRVVVVTLTPSVTATPEASLPTGQPTVEPTATVTQTVSNGVTVVVTTRNPQTNTVSVPTVPTTPAPSSPSAPQASLNPGDPGYVPSTAPKYLATHKQNEQRYLNFQYPVPADPLLTTYQIDGDLSRVAVNSMDIWVAWKDVEPEKGTWDFSKYDLAIDKLALQGKKSCVRLSSMDFPKYVRDEDLLMKSPEGQPSNKGCVTYAAAKARQYVGAFYRNTVKHFRDRYAKWPGGSPVHLYLVCHSGAGEFEYYEASNVYDYSSYARENYKKWLQKRYVDISLLNERWGTNYASFNVAVQNISGNLGDMTNSTIDWLQYRAWEQGDWLKEMSNIVHSTDKNAILSMHFGSQLDSMGNRRGSFFSDYWIDHVDWIGVGQCVAHTSFVRGISKGKPFATELESNLQHRFAELVNISFSEGSSMLDMYQFYDPNNIWYDRKTGKGPHDIMFQWLKDHGDKVVRPKPTATMYLSTYQLVNKYFLLDEGFYNKKNEIGAAHLDVIRDGTFENDVDYLVKTYKDIYFFENNSEFIADSARAALLDARDRGVTLHIPANSTIGTKDKYGNARLGLLPAQLAKDSKKPVVKGNGYKDSDIRQLAGVAIDPADGSTAASGIRFVEVSFDNGSTWKKATGTDAWTIDTSKVSAGTQAKVRAKDCNGNYSNIITVTVK